MHSAHTWLRACALAIAVTLGATPAARAAGVTEFSAGISPGAGPVRIAAGPDGNLWFTELSPPRVGRITPAGVITEYDLAPGSSSPGGIAAGPDGNLWFTQPEAIGRITPAGQIKEYTRLPTAGNLPSQIISGPDGAMWFVELRGLGRITPAGGIVEHPVSLPADVFITAIASGPDGNLWFVRTDCVIGHMSPEGKVSTATIKLSPFCKPESIVSGPDGRLWVTEPGHAKIARVTLSGDVTEFGDGLAPGAEPRSLAGGPDGNLWFTDSGGRIGRITSAGQIDEFTRGISTGSFPYGLATGADGGLWFTDPGANRIGRVALELPPIAATATASAAGSSWTLSGTVNPLGATASTRFEYGPTTAYGATIAAPTVAPAGHGVAVTATIAGLLGGTTYHYRIVATTPFGTATGADRSFTTPAESAPAAAPIPAPAPTPADRTAPAPTPEDRTAPAPTDRTAPALSRLSLRGRRATLRFTLSEPARVTLALARFNGRAKTLRTLRGARGAQRVRLGARLRPGRYRLLVTAIDVAGNRSQPATIKFTVR